METWRKVWRHGVVPQVSTGGLEALQKALQGNDERLLQGATTSPPPLHCVRDRAVEGACVIGYCGWQGDGLRTVAEVEGYFARVCFAVDMTLGEPAACRWFLNWFDGASRQEVRALLLSEVTRTLTERLCDATAAA
jgi:hypothetical protein